MKKEPGKNHPHARKTQKTRSHEHTQVAAYYEWQKRGEPIGEDYADWESAQQQWEDEEGDEALDIDNDEFD